MSPSTRSTLQRLVPIIGLVVFVAALVLIYDQLREFAFEDVMAYLRGLPPVTVALALLLTCLHIVVLSLYERLGIRYAGRTLPYRDIAFTSFVSNSLANTLGSPLVTGGAVRYRLYTSWGLSAGEVSKIILFSSITPWMGYLTLGGLLFLVHTYALPPTVQLPIPLWVIGLLFLVAMGSYQLISIFRREPLHVRSLQVDVPAPGIALGQALTASTGLAIVAGIVYVLLPDAPALTYLHVLSVYVLAAVIGSISQVPGGLGVLDGIVIVALAPVVPAPTILGALLAFRGIFYVLPLFISVLLITITETMRHRRALQRVAVSAIDALPQVVPVALSIAAFLAGLLLVVSGIAPAHADRMEWLATVVPLPLMELSHIVGILSGVTLLFLARALWLRLDIAYSLTIITLLFGISAALLKAVHYEEAIILLAILAAFIPCRRHFSRKTEFLSQEISVPHLAIITAAIASVVWLGLLLYQQDLLDITLASEISLDGNAARALRGLVISMILVVTVVLMITLRPARMVR